MKFNWRQSVLYLIAMGMEVSWLFALLQLINKIIDSQLSIVGLCLLYPIAFIFNKIGRQWRWFRLQSNLINFFILIISILLVTKIQLYGNVEFTDTIWLLALPRALLDVFFGVFRQEMLLLLGGMVLWWLGVRLSYQRNNFSAMVAEFQFGLVILIIIYFISAVREAPIDYATAVIFSFFILSLIGMALAHTWDNITWGVITHKGLWVWVLIACVAIIVILALLLSITATAELVQLVIVPLEWLWNMVNRVMEFLVSLMPSSWFDQGSVDIPDSGGTPDEFGGALRTPDSVRQVAELVFTIGVAITFLLALWRLSTWVINLIRRRRAKTAEVEQLHGAFRTDLLNFLRNLLRKLLSFRLPWWRRRESLPQDVVLIRRIYAQLLDWMANHGWPRLIYQTPHEYLQTMKPLLPKVTEELTCITEEYVKVRYGIAELTEERLGRFRQSWHIVKRNHLKKRHNKEGSL